MMRVLVRLASLLVLPLAALLFTQWPLRDVVQAGSRTANDVAQILFALYMAVAVTAASRAGTHLAAHGIGHAPGRPAARWKAWALLACTAPWAAFMLWSAAPVVLASLKQFERFGETLTPGYWLIKLALWLLVLLVLVQAILQAIGRGGPGADEAKDRAP